MVASVAQQQTDIDIIIDLELMNAMNVRANKDDNQHRVTKLCCRRFAIIFFKDIFQWRSIYCMQA